jgi:hypothetical protein
MSGVRLKFSLIPVAVLRKVKFEKFVLTTLQVSVILGSQSNDALDTVQTTKYRRRLFAKAGYT